MEKFSDIHNFINNYPCQNDEEIQWKIACRKEFNELQSKRKNPEKFGNFFNHQEVLLRYVRQYDKIFNIQATGTGKTGGIINIGQYYRKNNTNIKRVYILEPGPNTVDDFKGQILKLSGLEDFESEKLANSLDMKNYKNRLTRLIKKWYEVDTYTQFYRGGPKTDEEIIETYSDCVFFFDEAHTLRNKDLFKESNGAEMSEAEYNNMYDYLWKVCHLAKRSKIIVGSATPMVIHTGNFVPLLNLLLDEDQQLPIVNDKDFYDKVTLSQLEPFFRGKITFIRFPDLGIKIVNEGETLDNYLHEIESPKSKLQKGEPLIPVKKMILNGFVTEYDSHNIKQNFVETCKKKYKSTVSIVMLPMGEQQLKVYKKLPKNVAFSTALKQCSNFVFPNGEIGTSGFKSYTQKNVYGEMEFVNRTKKGAYGIPAYINITSPEKIEKTFDHIEYMSPKYRFVIEKEFKASVTERPGKCFCYVESVTGGGSDVLSLLLEEFKFINYKSSVTIIDPNTKKIKASFPKKKRFAVLTGKTNNAKDLLDLFNSDDNIDGEYIQILIASKVARDGINLKNVLRGYLGGPSWHESGMYQAISRFIRADSHNLLLERAKKEGKELSISIYRLASCFPEEREIIKKTGKAVSIDVQHYIASESKDIKIKRILRFMKQCSFDAYINYDRNVDKDDKKNCSSADYDDVYYKIWKAEKPPLNNVRKGMAKNQGPSVKDYVYNTYNLMYSRPKINTFKSTIINKLKKDNILPINSITSEKDLPPELEFVLYDSINQLVSGTDNIFDNNGIVPFIVTQSRNIIKMSLQSYNENNNRIETVDNFHLEVPYSSLNTEDKEDKDIKAVTKTSKVLEGKTEPQIKDYYIQTQNYNLFKHIIEESLVNYKNNSLTKLNKMILKLFKNYILITKIPQNYIKETTVALTTEKKKGQGRNREKGSQAGLKYIDLNKTNPGFSDKEIDIDIVHFYRGNDKTGFSITSIFTEEKKEIRILRGDSFEDADTPEMYVYSYMFNQEYKKEMDKYKKYDYYGTYILRGGEGKDYIVEKERTFFRIIDNSNPKSKGQVCSTVQPYRKLENILKYLDVDKKYEKMIKKKQRKEDICDMIKEMCRSRGILFESM